MIQFEASNNFKWYILIAWFIIFYMNFDKWIVIDKPLGMTSTQVLGKVRKLLGVKKVGHLGTLDPLATGVLPIALGEATKTIPFINDHTKEYEFNIIFGIESETQDLEGINLENLHDFESVSESAIRAILPAFNGKITQTPPQYSAVKINGVPAYKLARAGEVAEIKPREVEIYSLKFLGMVKPYEASFKVVCSTGTYVRSLAVDICKKLGVKGVVSLIRRLQSGVFKIEDSILLENLEKISYNLPESQNDVVNEIFLSLNKVLADIPGLVLNQDDISLLQHGQFVKHEFVQGQVRIVDDKNNLIAIAKSEDGFLKPLRIFNNK